MRCLKPRSFLVPEVFSAAAIMNSQSPSSSFWENTGASSLSQPKKTQITPRLSQIWEMLQGLGSTGNHVQRVRGLKFHFLSGDPEVAANFVIRDLITFRD